ncbi:MAG TPA: AAA family ATPase [Leptospiraceae bacterium]|nr:AAA family ATPase [Leptospiraceae bacterium]HMY66849.1 AAA family ATPase [Leptospiraceae bacterium]HNF26792.1 AAA family ATPase [Leptospiraceae bacterium]HNN04668.1 AAA family ATPase [Leptospiraceae bacterium]HNO22788.1 AAA family ATPase [Leptospiraceae bacterium]
MKYYIDPSKYEHPANLASYPSLSYAESHFLLENGFLPAVEKVSPYYLALTAGEAYDYTKSYLFPFEEFIGKIEELYPEYKLLYYNTENGIPSGTLTLILQTNFSVQLSICYFMEEETYDGKKTFATKYISDIMTAPPEERIIGIDGLVFLYSLSAKGLRERISELERVLYGLRKEIYIPPQQESPPPVSQISIICKTLDGAYYVGDRDFYEEDEKYRNYDLDLHYGTGFEEKYHDPLMKRLRVKSNGIVLFHGSPGTGKTFYIRRLIKELYGTPGKKVIIVPSTFVKDIATPEFFNFLYNFVQDNSVGLVLVIEDAENILKKRSSRNSFEAISNILNMTDGLLNDFVHIQIIATFNTELENIDSAILRHKRLLSKKEFYRLKQKKARTLAEAIGISADQIQAMNAETYSLAEIYSLTDTVTDELLLNPEILDE